MIASGAVVSVLPCGPLASMFEVGDTAAAVALAGWLRGGSFPGVVEIVPAARTVLVRCSDPPSRVDLERRLAAYGRRDPPTSSAPPVVEKAGSEVPVVEVPVVEVPVVEVPVVYDGPDLGSVAATVGCSVAEVIERHSATVYAAAFCGFAPGFTYLTGLDPLLHIARRDSPRSRVPAGSLAIAAEFTAVYPTASPGGWHLVGSTDAVLWDIARPQPALLSPGCRVRFVRR